MRRAATLMFIFLAGVFFLTAQEENPPNPHDWVIETYQFPNDELVHGFTSPDRGALRPPPVPPEDATVLDIQDYIRKSSSIVSHYLEMNGLALPKGSLVIYDPQSLTLSARLPRIAHSSLSFTVDEYRNAVEKYLNIEQSIFEAPGQTLRDIAERAGAGYDHTPLLEELQKAVSEGNATLRNSANIICRSGNRAKVSPAGNTTEPDPDALVLDAKDQVEFYSSEHETGTTFEVDPVLGSDNETVDLNLTLRHFYAPKQRLQAAFTSKGKTIISAAVSHTTDAKVTSQYTTKDGAAKLMAIWKPETLEEAGEKDVLQAGFTTAHVVSVLPLVNETLSDLLEKHGDKVTPIPKGKPEFEKQAEEIPDGMIVRRYTIPPTFLSAGAGGRGAAASDPFAPSPVSEPRFTVRVTAKDILQSAGILFPQGSSANYLSNTSTLVVRNTPDQISLVEAYIMSIRAGVEKSIAITLHVVEGPGDLIREAARKSSRIADHIRVWEELQENPDLSILTTNWIEARSGNRAKVESGTNYHYPAGADVYAETGTGKKGEEKQKDLSITEVSGIFEQRKIGTIFEVDPVLGADNTTIDLNFAAEHHYAPPTVTGMADISPEAVKLDGPTTTFHVAKVVTQITLRHGMTRLVSTWKPEGLPKYDNADIMQAAFIRAEVIRLEDDDENDNL